MTNQQSIVLAAALEGAKPIRLLRSQARCYIPILFGKELLPSLPELAPANPVRLVTFEGERANLVEGAPLNEDGSVRAKSLIGHVAYALGGTDALESFREYDDSLQSPGSDLLERLIGDEPCLTRRDGQLHQQSASLGAL